LKNQKDMNSNSDQELMSKVDQAFDEMVQDVRSMVQEKEQKNSDT
jgi:hypothetical protein